MKDWRLQNIISTDYLCLECKSPIYIEVGVEEERCFNPNCVLYLPDIRFIDVSRSKQVKEELKQREQKMNHEVKLFDGRSFINYLYRERLAIIRGLVTKGIADSKRLLAIDELLLQLSKTPPAGNKRKIKAFGNVLKKYTDLFQTRHFIEDLESGRFMITIDDRERYWAMKYWKVVMDLYRNYGIVAGKDGLSKLFQYEDMENEVKELGKLEDYEDWGRYFHGKLFDIIIGIGYALESNFFVAEHHRYNPTGVDIATFLGLAFSVPENPQVCSLEWLKRHYERTSKGRESFEAFKERFISGKSLAPIIVHDSKGYLLDRSTLMFYSLYLIGRNRLTSPDQAKSSVAEIEKKRIEVAEVFESRVRKRLQSAGYNTFGPIKKRFRGMDYECDAIAVDDKEILSIEAKFRDFAPSSLTGKTIVKQELLNKDRLLDWADQAQNNYEFLKRYLEEFRGELHLAPDVKAYEVRQFLVTKFKPLVSRYRNVRILDYWDFINELSRVSSS